MKPRKRVLLIGTFERDVLALSYVLNSKPWCACNAVTPERPLRDHLRRRHYDAALIFADVGAIPAIRAKHPGCRILIVGPADPTEGYADAQIRNPEGNAEIIEMLRILCARKRGPKPRGER